MALRVANGPLAVGREPLAVSSNQLPATSLQSPVSNPQSCPPANNQYTNTPITNTLPAHLGWDSPAVTAMLRRGDRQGLKPLATHTKPAGSGLEAAEECGETAHCSLLTAHSVLSPQHSVLKHYPTLGAAALQGGDVPCYRVWLACRFLDEAGRGWLGLEQVEQELAGGRGVLSLGGLKRLRQVLAQGEGRYWERDEQGRLWLYGVAKVAAALQVEKLTGRPVLLPLTALTGGIQVFKAHLYAAWHSGRKTNNPITRQVQADLTGVPERTQRAYGRLVGLEVQSNIAIGERLEPEKAQERAWEHGRAVFTFTDVQGQQGPKNRQYIAWHLPNSYTGPHQRTSRGRQKKINRKLNDLVKQRAQGNGQGTVERVFYVSGREAGRAYQKKAADDIYWPFVRRKRRSAAALWGVMSQ